MLSVLQNGGDPEQLTERVVAPRRTRAERRPRVAQVAVALMLLTGAGLLIHSFAEVLKVDTGLEPMNMVTARIALTRQHRASDDAANKIRERLLQAMREMPGVTSVALSFSTPFQGGLCMRRCRSC